MNVQNGRVQEIQIKLSRLPRSSSTLARYLLSPVFFLNSLAIFVRMIDDLVSPIHGRSKMKAPQILLKELSESPEPF